jgi:uncharacterized protein (DUF779 family)
MRTDYTGKRFGALVFARYGHSDGKNAWWWWCQCDCGREVLMRSVNVRNPNNKSCGCHRNKLGSSSNAFRGCGAIGSSFLSYIKTRAKYKSIEIGPDLTVEYLSSLFESQSGCCALSGQVLYPPDNYKVGWKIKTNMSLDRIDSSEGYIVGNVQWVTKQVNFMKQSYTQDEFISVCKKVVDFNEKVKDNE